MQDEKCKKCGSKLNADNDVYPNCGIRNKRPNYLLYFIIAVVLLFVFFFHYGNKNPNSSTTTTTTDPQRSLITVKILNGTGSGQFQPGKKINIVAKNLKKVLSLTNGRGMLLISLIQCHL